MSTTVEVQCPSGLVVVVRGFKVKEANILADAAAVRRGTTHTSVLQQVCVEMLDAGPYPFDPNKGVDWRQVLVADRFVALLNSRVATYGAPYGFRVQCTNEFCRKAIDWELDLKADLPVKPVPAASLEAMRNKTPLQVHLDGRTFDFKLLVGADEEKTVNIDRTRIMSAALGARITGISGVHPSDRQRVLDDLDMGTAQALVDAMDEQDGGVDTNIDIECPHCAALLEQVTIPFGRDFYLPRRRPAAQG